MKRTASILIASMAALTLSACGSDAPTEPIEQIVVREPGQAAATAADTGAAAVAGLVDTGRSAFAACAACHSVTAGDASGAGPNLHGVVGRTAGSLGDFKFSSAMTASGITWDDASLDAFLKNPSEKVPGTSMAAGAVGDAAKREAIIAYLASTTG